jgi:predicted dienelactone hydrolase
MTLVRAAFALVCIAMCAGSPTPAQTSAAVAAATFTVRQASVDDPGHPAIPVVIWTPSSGSALGLIVMSHGTGAGPTAHSDTAKALADAGFVVVAPMHPGDNFQDESVVGKPAWFADRSRHVSKVIDYMLTVWDGHARLAHGRIGIFGVSAGATTALISIGGVPDIGRIAPHCATTPEFVCKILVPQTGGETPQWTHDSRIAAAAIAAPGIGFAFEPAGLANVRVAVQLWSGSADDTVPYATNAAIVRRLLPKAPEFHSVDGAVHLSFLAPCTPETPPFLCQDKSGFDRAAFHRTFNEAVTAFFRQQLRGQN